MASVRLRVAEAQGRRLPPVCLVCGAAADLYRPKQFLWTSLGARLLLPLGTWYYWKAWVSAPLCEDHRLHWTWRWVLLLLVFLALLGGICGTYIASDMKFGSAWARAHERWFFLAGGVALVAWHLLKVAVDCSGVHATYIDRETITLAGVSEEFVEEVEGLGRRGPSATRAVRLPVPEVLPAEPPAVLPSLDAVAADEEIAEVLPAPESEGGPPPRWPSR